MEKFEHRIHLHGAHVQRIFLFLMKCTCLILLFLFILILQILLWTSMTLILRELNDLSLTRILLTPTTAGVQRVRKVLTSHDLIRHFLLWCERISGQRTHLLIVVWFTICVIRGLLSICALRVIRGEFVIAVKNHGKYEFELAADHRPQCPLRYGFLVLSQ
jgi:hypothetical protein